MKHKIRFNQIPLRTDGAALKDIIAAIEGELSSACHRFPDWPVDVYQGHAILAEEVGEAIRELVSIPSKKGSLALAEYEYIQAAAMCIRQIHMLRYLKNLGADR